MAWRSVALNTPDIARRSTLSLDIFAVLVSVVSYWCSLQRYGVYDYFDGMRYLASGVSLLRDGTGSPVPIAYLPNVSAADFVHQETLNYPSIPFQLWTAITTGAGALPLVATSLFGMLFYIVHNVAFARVGRQFLTWPITVAAVLSLCFIPSIFHQTMTRPLPDSFLCMAFMLGLYLTLINRPIAAGAVVALASVTRFQGLIFSWSIAFMSSSRRNFLVTLLAFAAGVGILTVALSTVSTGVQQGHSGGNFGFYLNLMSPDKAAVALHRIPNDIIQTVSALLAAPEITLLLISSPFILVTAILTSDKKEKSILFYFLFGSFYISLASYYVITASIGGGYDTRYLVYIIPSVILANFICFAAGLRRFPRFTKLASIAIVAASVTLTAAVIYYATKREPLWERDYLPDMALRAIPADKVIALATAEEAASEIYVTTKARQLMWLPHTVAGFTAVANPNVDYLVVGGFWNSPYDDNWVELAKSEDTIVDAGGNEFENVQRTMYYEIYARKTLNGN